MKRITVLISDDHPVFRQGVRSLLAATKDIDVIGEVENGRLAVGETRRLQPDVVLMDIAMPVLNGLDATRRIAREVPATKVLILSAYGDIQQATEAGAVGYLTKETASGDLVRAIRELRNRNDVSGPPRAAWFPKPRRNHELTSESPDAPSLTSRQSEVLLLIAEGCSTREIAGRLSLSIKTVEKHRQSLMDKMDIHEVARYAVSSGVVESNCAPTLPASRAPVHPELDQEGAAVIR